MKFYMKAAIRAAFFISTVSKFSIFQERKLRNDLYKAKLLVVTLLFFALLLSQTASAQEKEKIDQSLEEIEVTAPAEVTSKEKPSAFTTTIDPKPFENQVKTLPELLSQQPGVNVQQYGGSGQFSTVTIRGSTAEQVTVLLDGVKINTAQGGAVDFSSIPLDAIDRIEILRGGASTQFGSDAIGGVVNIITKKAKKKQTIELAAGGGSFTTTKATVGYSRRFEKISFLVDHTHLQSKGNFKFKTTSTDIAGVPLGGGQTFPRDNNSFFSENGLVRIEGDPTDRIHLSLTSDWFGSKREVPPTEEEVILLSPANPPEAKENILKNVTTLRADLKSIGTENLDLFAQPYYRYDFSHFTDPSSSLGGAIDTKSYNQLIGGKLGGQYPLKTGEILHTLKWNYENRYETFDNFNLLQGPSTGFHDRMTNALFFSNEISLWEDRLSFNPSGRFEHTNDFGPKGSGHLGISGRPLSWLILKTNFDNSFRYPNFNELYFPNEQIIRGNPDLKPETAINFDAGAVFRHRYGRHEVSYFFNRVNNSIIYVPVSSFTIQPINTRQVHIHGIEASTNLSPWKHLDIDANYTLLIAHFVASGNQLPGRPRQKVNGKLTLKNKWGSLYTTLQFIDDMPIDVQNTTFLKRRAQIDVGGTVKFLKNYYLAMEARNITNTQMLDGRGFPLPRFSAFGSFGVRM